MANIRNLISFLRKLNTSLLYRTLGIRLTKNPPFGQEIGQFDKSAHEIAMKVRDRTMTSENSIFNLIEATRYVAKNNISGDFVECGVWRGGSMLAVAFTLDSLKIGWRDLYLYDTFQGMTPPTELDIDLSGKSAQSHLSQSKLSKSTSHQPGVIAFATLEDVKKGMGESNYPVERIHYVQGDVATTLLEHKHTKIALLRLDTDWYESTKIELEELWDLLVPGGVLILDDYDYWVGAKTAVDEFFLARNMTPLMMKISSGGRILIKT